VGSRAGGAARVDAPEDLDVSKGHFVDATTVCGRVALDGHGAVLRGPGVALFYGPDRALWNSIEATVRCALCRRALRSRDRAP
jgi:hypothetical protein